ncbi:hypothetical protein D9M71_402630 [compost metagenome]
MVINSLPFNRLAPHCRIKTKIAETRGTPIACGKPKIRLLKIVVAIDSAKTTVNACSRKKLPMNTLLLGQRPNKRNFARSTKLNKKSGINNAIILKTKTRTQV